MNSEPLVRSVLAALLLLENSDDSEVDPDVAVAGIEAISHELQEVTPSDIEDFLALVARIAESEEDPAYREFYRSVPFALGIPYWFADGSSECQGRNDGSKNHANLGGRKDVWRAGRRGSPRRRGG